jgi:hypothetical protein
MIFFNNFAEVLRDVDFRNPVMVRAKVRVRVGVRDRIMVRVMIRVRVMVRVRGLRLGLGFWLYLRSCSSSILSSKQIANASNLD